MLNRATMKADLERLNSVLEIGPFHTPFLTGANVKYCDVFDRDELLKRAKIYRLPLDNIPAKIDYVTEPTNLEKIKDKFDAVFSSHCIEHQPDLVEHLRQLSSLLNHDGKVYLAIPDKRYCFDHFLPASQLSEVLAAFGEKRKEHTLRSIIQMMAFTGHNDPVEYWKNPVEEFNIEWSKVSTAIAHYQAGKENREYLDAHAWQFTPDEFAKIIKALYELKLTDLQIKSITETVPNSNEFYCELIKAPHSDLPSDSISTSITIKTESQTIQNLRENIQQIKNYYINSRSWRFTAPLRKVMNIYRKLCKKA